MSRRNFFAELKRRKVVKIGAAYLVVAWLAVQAASIDFPAFDAPPWALRVFILIALLGFPIAVVMAWVFDFTREGVSSTPIARELTSVCRRGVVNRAGAGLVFLRPGIVSQRRCSYGSGCRSEVHRRSPFREHERQS
jgi:hypothetical protein